MIDVQDINPIALPSVALKNKAQLPAVPAVYFAIGTGDAVVYIGKAECLKTRWQQHHRYTQLANDSNTRIAWLEMNDASILMDVEKRCIAHFQPKYNRKKMRADHFTITKSPDIYGEVDESEVQYESFREAVKAANTADNYEDIFIVWQWSWIRKNADVSAFIFQGGTYYKRGF